MGIYRKTDVTSTVTLDMSRPKKKRAVDDLPLPKPDSVAAFIYPDFKSILKEGCEDFYLPEEAEVRIDKGLEITHPNFRFNIAFGNRSCGEGPERSSPFWPLLIGEVAPDSKTLQSQPLDHVMIECTLKASFDFPEEDIQDFKDYFHFAETIRDHLLHDWDYDRFREKLADPALYTIAAKLDEIIAKMVRPTLLEKVKKQIKGLGKKK